MTNEYMDVRKSNIHSTGVFAKKFIPKGTRITEYIGDKLTKEEADKRLDDTHNASRKDAKCAATYIFEINNEYDIDGNVPENDARFINHSCDPNCEVDIIEDKIWIDAIKDIQEGEELCYDYGFDFDEDFHEHPCKCGAKNCVGYIINSEHWEKLKEHLNEKEQNKNQYHKILKLD